MAGTLICSIQDSIHKTPYSLHLKTHKSDKHKINHKINHTLNSVAILSTINKHNIITPTIPITTDSSQKERMFSRHNRADAHMNSQDCHSMHMTYTGSSQTSLSMEKGNWTQIPIHNQEVTIVFCTGVVLGAVVYVCVCVCLIFVCFVFSFGEEKI